MLYNRSAGMRHCSLVTTRYTGFTIRQVAQLLSISASNFCGGRKLDIQAKLNRQGRHHTSLRIGVLSVRERSGNICKSPQVATRLRSNKRVVARGAITGLVQSLNVIKVDPQAFGVHAAIISPLTSFPSSLIRQRFSRNQLSTI